MSDIVLDSCVVAKWFLPESDYIKAQALVTRSRLNGDRLVVLDLVFPEVTNAIWKRFRQKSITLDEARKYLLALLQSPVQPEAVAPLLPAAFEIAAKYDRSIYDALFVALVQNRGVFGITADEPLFNATHRDFPSIQLLRNL